jgi:hypothetical protein
MTEFPFFTIWGFQFDEALLHSKKAIDRGRFKMASRDLLQVARAWKAASAGAAL